MRLCVNCKFYSDDAKKVPYSICTKGYVSPVDGNTVFDFVGDISIPLPAFTMRVSDALCGKDAIYFEEKIMDSAD